MPSEAAASLVYLFGDEAPQTGLELRLISQTLTKITLGWTAPAGAVGYRFSSSLTSKRSSTWDGTRDRVTFAAGAAWYMVEVLGLLEMDIYP